MALACGLARFDFSAVGRIMIENHWIRTTGLGELAGLNVAAYGLGTFHHFLLSSRRAALRTMTVAVLIIVLSFWLAAFESGFAWQVVSRASAGWASGHLVSGIPILALVDVPLNLRRRGSAFVQVGVGLGTLIGAFMIATFAPSSSYLAWICLAILATATSFPTLWLIRSSRRDQSSVGQLSSNQKSTDSQVIKAMLSWRVAAVITGGGLLVGAAQCPIILYAPIVISHRLGGDAALSSESLAFVGAGAVVGALSVAFMPRRWPSSLMLPFVAAIGLISNVLFLTANSIPTILLTIFLMGMWLLAIISLSFVRLADLLPSSEIHRRIWSVYVLSYTFGFVVFAFSFAGLASSNLNALISIGVLFSVLHLIVEILQQSAYPIRPAL